MSELMTSDMPETNDFVPYIVSRAGMEPDVILVSGPGRIGATGEVLYGVHQYNWVGIRKMFDGCTIESLSEHDDRIREETAREVAGRYAVTRGPLTQEELDKSQRLLDSLMSGFVKAPRLADRLNEDSGKGSK